MKHLLSGINLIIGLLLSILFPAPAGYGQAVEPQEFDIRELRRSFIRELGGEFQFVKDELRYHVENSEKRAYWLAHVKPGRTGFFTIKYDYQFEDKFYASGKTEMNIAVNGKICTRYPQIVREIAYFCLGDTVIVPIRLDKYSKHRFSLKSKYVKAVEIEESRQMMDFYSNKLKTEKIANPLESSLKYLGRYQTERLYRSGGGEFSRYAVFEAKSANRFNLGVSLGSEKTNNQSASAQATPIVIVNRGTPITSLIPLEQTTYYNKTSTYSSDYTVKFESNLIILQPGERVAIFYSAYAERPFWKDINDAPEKRPGNENPKPVISKHPFSLTNEISFNEWVVNYLPGSN